MNDLTPKEVKRKKELEQLSVLTNEEKQELADLRELARDQ